MKPLITALLDGEESVRQAAAEALEEIGDLLTLPERQRMTKMYLSVLEKERQAAKKIHRRWLKRL